MARSSHGRLLEVATLRGLLRPPSRPDLLPGEAFRVHRDHAIVCLLAESTLRVSDVRLLLWSEVVLTEHLVRIRRRNGTLRLVPLGRNSVAALASLNRARGGQGPDGSRGLYCFPSRAGLPLSRQAFCYRVRKWANGCGSQRTVTPSLLRHASRAANRGRAGYGTT